MAPPSQTPLLLSSPRSYFNVNRWMIDDIRDIITSKRRASMRTGRMTHRRGNVWSFIAAPKYVVTSS